MIGKSWDGSIANGVAATGVEGLSTIVPISSISSWYDYTRFGGVLRSPGYVQFLASYVGGRPSGVCAAGLSSPPRLVPFWASSTRELKSAGVSVPMALKASAPIARM